MKIQATAYFLPMFRIVISLPHKNKANAIKMDLTERENEWEVYIQLTRTGSK